MRQVLESNNYSCPYCGKPEPYNHEYTWWICNCRKQKITISKEMLDKVDKQMKPKDRAYMDTRLAYTKLSAELTRKKAIKEQFVALKFIYQRASAVNKVHKEVERLLKKVQASEGLERTDVIQGLEALGTLLDPYVEENK